MTTSQKGVPRVCAAEYNRAPCPVLPRPSSDEASDECLHLSDLKLKTSNIARVDVPVALDAHRHHRTSTKCVSFVHLPVGGASSRRTVEEHNRWRLQNCWYWLWFAADLMWMLFDILWEEDPDTHGKNLNLRPET